MPIDANIYSSIQAPQINIPNPMDVAERGLRLSTLGMQQAQMGYQMQSQNAIRNAYAQNTDPQSGQLDRGGFLSQLGKVVPMAVPQMQAQFAAQDKAQAEAQKAQMDSVHAQYSITVPKLDHLLNLPDDQAAQALPGVLSQMKDQGIDTKSYPTTWNRDQYKTAFNEQNSAIEQINKQKAIAETGKIVSDIGETQDKRLQALKDDLDPDKARSGNLADNQARVYSAQRLKALLAQTNGNPDRRQMEELAIGAQNMLSNGNGSVEQVKQLVPQSAWGNSAKMYEWFNNDPTGTNQQKFVQRLGDTINREMEIANTQVRSTQVARAGAHQLLQRSNPGAYWTVLSNYGINPDEVKNGKYVKSSGPGDSQSIGSTPGALIQSANASETPSSKQQAPSFRASGATVTADEAAQYAMKHSMSLKSAKTFLGSKGYVVDDK